MQDGILIHYIKTADIWSIEFDILIIGSGKGFVFAKAGLLKSTLIISVDACEHQVNILTTTLAVQIGVGVCIPTLDARGVALHLLSVHPVYGVSSGNHVIAYRKVNDRLACTSVLRGIKINIVTTCTLI